MTITLSSLSTDMFVEVDVYQTEKKIKKIHVTKKKKKLDVFIETDCKRQSLNKSFRIDVKSVPMVTTIGQILSACR